jgi:hypothetical protein
VASPGDDGQSGRRQLVAGQVLGGDPAGGETVAGREQVAPLVRAGKVEDDVVELHSTLGVAHNSVDGINHLAGFHVDAALLFDLAGHALAQRLA